MWLGRRKTMYIKKSNDGSPSTRSKFKANKTIKTQATKGHNNQDTNNTQIK
jgi:hypothetical protein